MIDDYNYDDNEDRSPDAQDLEVAAQYNSRRQNTAETTDATPSEMNVELEAPGDMGQLPHKMLLNLPPGRQPTGDNRYVDTTLEFLESSLGDCDALSCLPKDL